MMSVQIKNCQFLRLKDGFEYKVADIHFEALPEDVLPSLGIKFLRSYYKYILNNESQYVLGVFKNDKLVGFCQLSFSHVKILDFFKIYPLKILHLLKLIMLQPKKILIGLFFLIYRFQSKQTYPEICFIAVKKKFQRTGLGSNIIEKINKISRSKGFKSITTKTSNKIACIFYRDKFNAVIEDKVNIFGLTYWFLKWNA